MTIELNGHCFVTDGEILWLRLLREGSPDAWESGTNYKIGDLVIPSVSDPNTDPFMFQCVGFLRLSGSSEPSFNLLPGEKTVDGDVEWTARDKNSARPKLQFNEYFLIEESVTVK